MGIDEKKLYYLSKSEYFNLHPELRSESSEIRNSQYLYYEEARKNRIERAIQKREELKSKTANTSIMDSRNGNTSICVFDQNLMRRNQEQIKLMKKQNLYEIKNFIDYEINLNLKRSASETKQRLQMENDSKQNKQKYKNSLIKRHLAKKEEEKRQQQIKIENKKQTKEFQQQFKAQVKEILQEEQILLKMQKINLQKQLDAQKKEQEFRDKLEEKYQHHMKELLHHQHEINVKNDERIKKIELRKINQKNEMQQKQINRQKKFQSAQLQKERCIIDKYNKYNEHQINILKVQHEQKMKKENEIREMQIKRVEKEKKNLETKNKNEQIKELQRQSLIKEIKENEEKVEQYKQNSYKKFMNNLVKKRVKHLEKEEKLEEHQLKQQFQNYLKLKEIEEKQKKAEEFLKVRDELIHRKINLKNEIRNKKEKLLAKANKLLSSGTCVIKEEIYKKVFSNNDLELLHLDNCINHNKSVGYTPCKHRISMKKRHLPKGYDSYDYQNESSYTDRKSNHNNINNSNYSSLNCSAGFVKCKFFLTKSRKDISNKSNPLINTQQSSMYNSGIEEYSAKYNIVKS